MEFPAFIEALPDIPLPMPGANAKLMQGVNHQVVFFRLPKGAAVPPHSHAAQWGVVVSGKIRLTVGDTVCILGPGDTYQLAEGEMHQAECLEDAVAVDFFNDPARYYIK